MRETIIIGLFTALISGCGAEISYKRGATAKDLQAGKNTCLKSGDEKSLEKCLEKNGWIVQKLDGSGFPNDDLFATASVEKDNRMTKPSENIIKSETTAEQVLPIDSNATQTTKETATSEKGDAPVTVSVKSDLLDTYTIKSWWKMGGSAALLENNMNECSQNLGDAHMPNKQTFSFTRGFAICLREKGWRGLIENK